MCNYLELYLANWKLSNPVKIDSTKMSAIYKVNHEGETKVLKLFTDFGKKHEAFSWIGLKHFGGEGAVKLHLYDEGAVLIDFLDGAKLKSTVRIDTDRAVASTICKILKKLHHSPLKPNENLWDLKRQFESLYKRAELNGQPEYIYKAKSLIDKLIDSEIDKRVLHGDVHHSNILFCSKVKDWKLIDPQPLFAERTYDLANTFYNPDDNPDLVESTHRIEYLTDIYSRELVIDRQRILDFAFCHGALSVCWQMEVKEDPSRRLRILNLIDSIL